MRWIVLFFWLLGGVLYATGAFTPSPIEPQAPAQTAATVSPDDAQQVSKSVPESGVDPSVVSNEPDNTPKAQNGTRPAPEAQNFPPHNSAASGPALVSDDMDVHQPTAQIDVAHRRIARCSLRVGNRTDFLGTFVARCSRAQRSERVFGHSRLRRGRQCHAAPRTPKRMGKGRRPRDLAAGMDLR